MSLNHRSLPYLFVSSKTFSFVCTYSWETVGWTHPRWMSTWKMSTQGNTFGFHTTGGSCLFRFYCMSAVLFFSIHFLVSNATFKGMAPGYLSSFLWRRVWTKSSSCIIFDKWTHTAPLQLQMPPNSAKCRCCLSPYICLITASKLRKLLCLVPLSRKTMSIKWTLLIQAFNCPCKGCILVLIMHYGNIINLSTLDHRLISLGQGESRFCAGWSPPPRSLKVTEEWCFKNVIAKAASSLSDKLQRGKSTLEPHSLAEWRVQSTAIHPPPLQTFANTSPSRPKECPE